MTMLAPIEPAPPPALPAPRHDGWTPERQRLFLEAVAEGHSVEAACRVVGLSHQSAYAFRRRATGQAFALGWQAARLIARDRIADALIVRAIEGQVETVTRDDGRRYERHRFDNRLAASMLARLDRLADARGDEQTHRCARAIAHRFDDYLDTLVVQCLPDADGIVREPQLPQLRTPPPKPRPAPVAPPEPDPVWWCEIDERWMTSFPPPDDFDGVEDGRFGEDRYERHCTDAEVAMIEAPEEARIAVLRVERGRARDAWFAAVAALVETPDAADAADAPGAWDG